MGRREILGRFWNLSQVLYPPIWGTTRLCPLSLTLKSPNFEQMDELHKQNPLDLTSWVSIIVAHNEECAFGMVLVSKEFENPLLSFDRDLCARSEVHPLSKLKRRVQWVSWPSSIRRCKVTLRFSFDIGRKIIYGLVKKLSLSSLMPADPEFRILTHLGGDQPVKKFKTLSV